MAGDGFAGDEGPYATTYDPFAVYIVQRMGDSVYSSDASRSYNLEHYVWAGPHSREDYAVVYNLPGHPKPFGTPASRLDTIMSKRKVAR